MALSESTVGAYSDLSVSFNTEHSIPISNGQINIDFPKWNPAAPVDKYQSYVDTQTTSVGIPCQPQLGFAAETEIECVFTTDTTKDTLSVTFTDGINASVPAGAL